MTKAEAIKIFNTVLFFGKVHCSKEEIEECFKMAIKALEQETVSRESYEHEYFLRKEFELKIYKLQRQLEEQALEQKPKCIWIKYDYRTICPKECGGENPYWRIPENMENLKYCPYCGREIEVKE